MDSLLIMIVIFAITGISGWLQKKAKDAAAEKHGERPSMPPERTGPRQQPPAQQTGTITSEIEAQLRQWIQGETPSKPAPPVVRVETPGPPPPIHPSRAKQVAQETVSVTRHAQALDAHLRQSPGVAKRAEELQRAANIHLKNSRPARASAPQRAALPPKSRRSPELASAIAMLRTPRTVRQAFVASFLLASPKGLEG